MYCFHDKIRIYFTSFIVQISLFVHHFTLIIVFRWGLSPLNPRQGSVPDLLEALKWPQTPRRKLFLHFIVYLATPLPITIDVMSSNLDQGDVYKLTLYVIQFASDWRQVSGFLRVLRFPPPIKLTATI